MIAAILLGVLGAAAYAQSLAGVVDIHAHSDPDSVPRSIDALSLVKLAKARGLRGILLKNHYEPTASLAWLVGREVPGIEVFGGIALNRTVGGINPAAVERMAAVKGGRGKVVWMPTFDSENQVRVSKETRPFVPVSRNGKLRREVEQVLDLMAKHNLVLATGHSSPEEVLMLIREARRRGVKQIVVTHPMLPSVDMKPDQMREAAREGAYLEFVYNALIGATKALEWDQYVRVLRTLGPKNCILSSDLGQAGNPLHPDGLTDFFAGLRKHGFSAAEIEMMAKQNPARLLGLPD